MIQDVKKSEIKVVGTVQDRMPQINEISITEQLHASQLNIKSTAAANNTLLQTVTKAKKQSR